MERYLINGAGIVACFIVTVVFNFCGMKNRGSIYFKLTTGNIAKFTTLTRAGKLEFG